MPGIKLFLFSGVLGLILLFTGACSSVNGEVSSELTDFGIYLEDSGELVISGEHIAAYSRNGGLYDSNDDSHAIELNGDGIERWNSFMYYEDIPKLKESLYQRNFVIRLKEKEIYKGRFYSMVSSQSYDGVVIMDSIMKLDEEHNRIHLCMGYPTPGFATGNDPRNAPEIIGFMEEHGLLK